MVTVCCGLVPANSKEPRGRSLTPLPSGVGRTMGKKRGKTPGVG